MRLTSVVLALSASLVLSACGDPATGSDEPGRARPASPTPTFDTVKVEEVAEEISAGDALLVDVRTDEEWDAGHAPRAMHVPLDEVEQRIDEIEEAAAGRPVAFICRTGRRSAEAAAIARAEGLEDVRNIDGGMEAWVDAGLPLEPEDGRVA